MSTLWNEDEHATFAVNLNYMNVEQANAWLVRRDAELGADKSLGLFLLEEEAITQEQYNMMMTLMGKPASAAGGDEQDPDYELYVECKQAARRGDIETCEKLMDQIQNEEYKYRAQIQTVKAQHTKNQLERVEEEE